MTSVHRGPATAAPIGWETLLMVSTDGSPADNQASSCRKLLVFQGQKVCVCVRLCICVCVCGQKRNRSKVTGWISGGVIHLNVCGLSEISLLQRASLQLCRGGDGGDRLKVMGLIVHTPKHTHTHKQTPTSSDRAEHFARPIRCLAFHRLFSI